MVLHKLAVPAFVIMLAALPVACAPQTAGVASPAPASSLSGPANAAPAAAPMPGMAGMDHSAMQGMDMNTMMAHCAQMRQGMKPGMAMPADMQQMMAQCDQMDRSMGMPAPRSR